MSTLLVDEFSGTFDFAFYDGVPTSSDVPSLFPVALAGHGYALDEPLQQGDKKHSHDSIPYLKPYFLTEADINERTLNPDGGWRRSQETWHKGAGQLHLDYTDSDRARFRTSKGVDVWDRWQLKLLHDTTLAISSVETNLKAVTVGPLTYLAAGASLTYFTPGVSVIPYPAVTGLPGGVIQSVDTDGYNVYLAMGTQGVYQVQRGAANATKLSSVAASQVAYVNGRLLIANGNALSTITDLAGTVAPVFTHPNPDFRWVGFTEGSQAIYVAGVSGDKSLIYRVGIDPNGTALTVPIIAGFIGDGEVVQMLYTYDGFVNIGTTIGIRLAQESTGGALVVGPYIPTAHPVRCAVGFKRFIWYGLENFDPNSTGLGRLDLQTINNDTPAYTSDLMATSQGQVSSVANWAGGRAFTVQGVGLFLEHSNLAPTGFLQEGLITFDIPDPKVALYVELRHQNPIAGSYTVSLSGDSGPFTDLATRTETGSAVVIGAGETHAEEFELQLTLNRGADPTTGPVIRRATLVTLPAAQSGETFLVSLKLFAEQEINGISVHMDVIAELAFLKSLRREKRVFVFQEGVTSYTVTMQDYSWLPEKPLELSGQEGDGFEGVFQAQLKALDPPSAS